MSKIDLILNIIATMNIYVTFLAATLTLFTKRFAWMLMYVAVIIVSIWWGIQLN